VLESLVSRLEKDQDWTGLDWKKTGLQSWSLIFKKSKTAKDRSYWTGLDWFKLVPYIPHYCYKYSQIPSKLMKN
jgi:hypothetical protein